MTKEISSQILNYCIFHILKTLYQGVTLELVSVRDNISRIRSLYVILIDSSDQLEYILKMVTTN